MPFDALHLRSLMVGSAELGELAMRSFIPPGRIDRGWRRRDHPYRRSTERERGERATRDCIDR